MTRRSLRRVQRALSAEARRQPHLAGPPVPRGEAGLAQEAIAEQAAAALSVAVAPPEAR